MSDVGSEHHHRDVRGGVARATVFGVSDGLVTNLAIILGVVGAHPRAGVVRLVGLAALLAGAFSMAAGEYVSMRAQAELLEKELTMEAEEIARHPKAERRELALIYESRGLDHEAAEELAGTMMRDPQIALTTHAREELGIDPGHLGSPWKAALSSLVATAFGAFVPLAPWLFARGTAATAATIVAAAVCAAAVGIALSRFTGRSWLFSAGRQLGICGVCAAITFGVGNVVGISTAGAATLPAGAPSSGSSYVSVGVDAAAHSSHAVNEDLIGVDGPGPTQAYKPLRAIGVHWVRTDVGFEQTDNGQPVYDCATGAWNPALLDQRVAGIHAEGGTPLLIVDYSPPCLTQDPTASNASYAPPDVGADQAKWDALVTQMALHEIGEGVRYFEVWNEPDWIFFTGGVNGYLQLYADTARSLEAAAAQKKVHIYVGGPALANVVDTQDTSWLNPFLAYISSNNLPLDFLSWHSYVNDPYAGPTSPGGSPICLGRSAGPGTNPCYYNPYLNEGTIAKEVGQARQALAAYPALHPLLIVDEWNVNGEGDPRMDQTYDASYAAAVLDSAQSVGLNGMSFFNVNNSATDPDQNWGMLSADFAPKPVYETFLFWHEMAPRQVPVSIATSGGEPANTDANGRVGAVASTAKNGAVTVLLYDFKPYDTPGNYGTTDPTPYDHAVELRVSGLKDARYVELRRAVDGSHNGGVVQHTIVTPSKGAATFDFTVSGEGVAFVTLTPKAS